ncbi:aminopeptidase P family protein [Pseudomonas putida]|nr:aminopeptidase P family protein [Pseudomonas putida]
MTITHQDGEFSLTLIQKSMREMEISACLINSGDPHLSEYLPEHWQSRRWLSGFSGSVGTLIVTQSHSILWVDSRYFEAAKVQVHEGVEVALLTAECTPLSWLVTNLQAGQTICTNYLTLSINEYRDYQAALKKASMAMCDDRYTIDSAWPSRPALPTTEIFEHPLDYTSSSRTEKIGKVREEMLKAGAEYHFMSSLDDIAWLLNLRGSDIVFNPLFLSYALIERSTTYLFIDLAKVPLTIRAQLALDGIRLESYERYAARLAELPEASSVLVDPSRISAAAYKALPRNVKVIEKTNPSQRMKACKSRSELDHVRRTMELDGAALCKFFAWLETALISQVITELTIDSKLMEFRSESQDFISPSFATIAGFNENGAMPHYMATADSHAVLSGNGLLLIDSGGQYWGGTTDITRMIAVGTPTESQRQDCTTVLKGMIALSRAHYPTGISGSLLDVLARGPLWERGLDYGHGTGHGVGYFLNVHEGPQKISYRAQPDSSAVLLDGMITSIEPGIYRPGYWGVRIENLVANVPASVNGEFLRFETLTLCPIDMRCIEISHLTPDEINWLNEYHQEVYRRLCPCLNGEPLYWLERSTRTISARLE